jgi:hypothetical protein
MARRLNLLSPKFVEMIDRPGRYADGGGLYLQVSARKKGGVTKCWLFRYMRGHVSRNGKPLSRELGLGPLSVNKRDGYITTKEARDRAHRARESLKAGIDPLDAKRAHRAAERLQGAILSWAKIHGYRDDENPARWKGHLDNALPKSSPVFPHREERPLGRVSKDGLYTAPSWFETAQERLVTMRGPRHALTGCISTSDKARSACPES